MTTDVETSAEAAKKRAEKAIARLRRYEDELKGELEACNNVVSDLLAYANKGKSADIPGRVARAQAIRTVLAAIPQTIAKFEGERNEALRQRNEAANILG